MNKIQNGANPGFSVIVPIYNEEENIPELCRRLTDVMENLCRENGYPEDGYEVLLIDDCSQDNSWITVKGLNAKDKRIGGMSFSRNFGHHIALTAGLDCASGDIVILLDGDLQDPPEEIPKLYKEMKQGYDLVYGIRQRRNDPFSKKLTSSLFWWILRRFSGVKMPANQTMLRIASRRMVNVLREMREYSRFIHGMMAWTGFTVSTVEIRHEQRKKGKSKYNVTRLFGLAFNAITSFSTVPLKLAIYIGLASSSLSFLAVIYFIYRKIVYNIPVLGYASIIVSIFLIGGIQLFLLGLFGEYLGRTYQEVQRRPLYIIKESL